MQETESQTMKHFHLDFTVDEEVWKDIPCFVGYYKASNLGNIKSVLRTVKNTGTNGANGVITLKEKIRKTNIDRNGYLNVMLTKDGKQKRYRVHRLITLSFHSNPENKPCVNHKDRVKTNNNKENLEWCTRKENCVHNRVVLGYRHSLETRRKIVAGNGVKVVNEITGKQYGSIKECASELGICYSHLANQLNGAAKKTAPVRKVVS